MQNALCNDAAVVAVPAKQRPGRWLSTKTVLVMTSPKTGRHRTAKSYLLVKLTSALLLIISLHVSATSASQRITFSGKDVSLEKVFSVIKRQTGYAVMYNADHLEKARPVSIKATNIPLEGFLQQVLNGQPFEYSIENTTIFISRKAAAVADPANKQDDDGSDNTSSPPVIDIHGRVVNEKGEPLVAAVSINKTQRGTTTDDDGYFALKNVEESAIIVFSSTGYVKQELAIRNRPEINITMVLDDKQLSEVMVTALGITKQKRTVGYASQELAKKDLTDARDISIANYLTGKIAGVQVSLPAAGKGGSSKVIIRGISSVTNENQPLYVVDGIPLDNSRFNEAQVFGDGHDYGDGIGNINPEDIESMNVLKGPNATALYGSRGSNGVIIITTKSGKTGGGIGVEVNSNVTIDKINQLPRVQNKYGPGYEDANIYGGFVEIDGTNYETIPVSGQPESLGPPLDGRLLVNPFVLPGTSPTTFQLLPQPEDNVRKFWETGVVTANSVSLSGGSEKTTARLSISNTTIDGITPKHHENHQSVSLRVSTQMTSRLSFDGKVNYLHKELKNTPTLGSSFQNYVWNLSTMGRYIPLEFLKEYYEKTGMEGQFPSVSYNPYYLMNEIKNNATRDRMVSFISAKYQFTDWLSLMARSGMDLYNERRREIWPVGAKYGNQEGRLIDDGYFTRESNSDVLLSAAKNNLFKNFSASLSLGGSISTRNYRRQSWDARSLKVPGIYDVSNARNVTPFYSDVKRENQSVYLSGEIGYKNFLFLDFTGRKDWSSTLGKDNYGFIYPSISGSFIFTDAFSIDPKILSFGKARVSYAHAGNDAAPYLTQAGFYFYSEPYNGQSSAYQSNTVALFDLKNELKKSTEIGADLRFFHGRIGVDATYYKSNTLNQILPVKISTGSGYTTKVVNAGNIENKGVEISLNVRPVESRSGFRWDVTFNYARNKSKIIELAPGIETYPLYTSYPNSIEARTGQAFGNIIGYAYKRAPDGQKIVGPEGAYLREDTVKVLGNVTPKWIGGLNNTVSYKGFTLSALVDFVQGNKITSSSKYQMVAKGIAAFTTQYGEHSEPLPGVVEVQDGSEIKYEANAKTVDRQTAWANRAWSGIGEEFVLDGSYVMLREVILGYTFQTSFLKRIKFSTCRFSIVARNLFYLEEHMHGLGISPETNLNTSAGATGVEALSMPTTRSYGVNLNFTF